MVMVTMISSQGQCELPLLLESGHSTKSDLRNPADFQRFTALAATVRNGRFSYARLSACGAWPGELPALKSATILSTSWASNAMRPRGGHRQAQRQVRAGVAFCERSRPA